MSYPPISEGQRELLARLVSRKQVTIEQLREAGVAEMNRRELATWLDTFFGYTADAQAHDQIDALFEDAEVEAPTYA